MSWLLDTVVVCELRKRRADPGLVEWSGGADPMEMYLSAVSVLELEIGVRRKERRDPAQGATLRKWLDEALLATFAGRLLPLDAAAARLTAALHVPDPRPERDAMIAGIAMANDLILVTRNTRDFEPMGVQMLNPWRS